MDANTSQSRKPRRLGYKKSKAGCQTCRVRKVKCDERRPKCLSCERFGAECEYITQPAGPSNAGKKPVNRLSVPAQSRRSISRSPSADPAGPETSDSATVSLPSTNAEPQATPGYHQRLELRLFHHFTTSTCETLPGGINPAIRERWSVHIPRLAFDHNALLMAILAVSAAHLHEIEPSSTIYKAAAREYFSLALLEQNATISNLSSNNADIACLTALLIRTVAFNFERLDNEFAKQNELANSDGVVQSLFVMYGCAQIFKSTWRWISNDQTSEAARFLKQSPQFQDIRSGKAGFEAFSTDHDYAYLVYNSPSSASDDEPFLPPALGAAFEDEEGITCTQEDEEAFRIATSYINATYAATKSAEPELVFCRRIMGLTASIPRHFIDMIKANRPRALLISAHHFALASAVKDVWWMRGFGERGMIWVEGVLNARWRVLLQKATLFMDAVGQKRVDIEQ